MRPRAEPKPGRAPCAGHQTPPTTSHSVIFTTQLSSDPILPPVSRSTTVCLPVPSPAGRDCGQHVTVHHPYHNTAGGQAAALRPGCSGLASPGEANRWPKDPDPSLHLGRVREWDNHLGLAGCWAAGCPGSSRGETPWFRDLGHRHFPQCQPHSQVSPREGQLPLSCRGLLRH